MRLSAHVVLTVPVAATFYGITKSWSGLPGVFITGILLDVDHWFEYWHDCGMNLNIVKFFEYGNSGINTHHYIILHSYEFLFLLFIGMQFPKLHYFFLGMIVGLIPHLFLDYVNICARLKYKWYSFILFSFIFRAFFYFKRDRIDKILRYAT